MGVEKIETETVALHSALGEAIAAWSHVEYELCKVFCFSLVPEHYSVPAERAFWSMVSFESKLKATNASVTAALDQDGHLGASWKTIHNKINEKSKDRNMLAHCALIIVNHPRAYRGGAGKRHGMTAAVLAPFYHARVRQWHLQQEEQPEGPIEIPSEWMTNEQVASRATAFSKLRWRIETFGDRLRSQLLLDRPNI